MQKIAFWPFAFLLSVAAAQAQDASKAPDSSPHKVQFVTVDSDVRLEVLDWGGTGKPLVFLAGLGTTAHEFDAFAPKFATNHHVYAITRRGYGVSSKPDPAHSDYSSDRLGEDVVAVIDTLKLDHPVLAGHSLAGEELSAVATRHPEKISGLIYLDAAFAYAYYTPGALVPLGAGFMMDLSELQKDSVMFIDDPSPSDIQTFKEHLAELQKDINVTQTLVDEMPTASGPKESPSPQHKITIAIISSMEKYTSIRLPVLAIYATDPTFAAPVSAELRAAVLAEYARHARQADIFQQGVPAAHVVKLPGAKHELWVSNEADVMREMNAFLATLH